MLVSEYEPNLRGIIFSYIVNLWWLKTVRAIESSDSAGK